MTQEGRLSRGDLAAMNATAPDSLTMQRESLLSVCVRTAASMAYITDGPMSDASQMWHETEQSHPGEHRCSCSSNGAIQWMTTPDETFVTLWIDRWGFLYTPDDDGSYVIEITKAYCANSSRMVELLYAFDMASEGAILTALHALEETKPAQTTPNRWANTVRAKLIDRRERGEAEQRGE